MEEVAIVGRAQSGGGAAESRTDRLMVHDAVTRALRSCSMTIRDIDVVIDAGGDLLDGRGVSNSTVIDAMGAARNPDAWFREEVTLEQVLCSRELEPHYGYPCGAEYARFYREMRDNRVIMGTKCSRCGVVLLPPRPYCGFCFVPPDGWSELSGEGTAAGYTLAQAEFNGQVTPPPYIHALIMLDGADVHLPHLLGEIEPLDARTGMRVRAVWAGDRKGTIHDIEYSRPA